MPYKVFTRSFAALAIALLASSPLVHAQAPDVYKIGILTDMSGPYSGMGGLVRSWQPKWR